jgi:outer membrane lipoprotein-sorting protein
MLVREWATTVCHAWRTRAQMSGLRDGHVNLRGDAPARAIVYMASMNRRTSVLAPLALLFLSAPASAAPIPLDELSRYFNGITTAEAGFTQVNADGTRATGTLYIRRPGRARFEYAPPEKSLVMAGGGQVAIFDARSNQPPEQYPLKRTPLNLILARNVDLTRAKMVVGHSEVDGTTRVIAQDPEKPEYGTIELVFTDNPVALREWIITDDTGSQTRVVLDAFRTGMQLSAFLFDITHEMRQRQR